MLELGTIKEIVKALEWIATLGKSEIKDYKNEVNDLISELSKSLTNLWDVVKQLTAIKEKNFSKDSFHEVYDYFFSFYAGDWNISPARTHCGNVIRSTNRIKFKVSKRLHGDLGRWKEIDKKIDFIGSADPVILDEYDGSIQKIDSRLKEIRKAIDNDIEDAKKQYFSLKDNLRSDIRFLKNGVKKMEIAIDHVNKHTG
jgi:hypothetical protein